MCVPACMKREQRGVRSGHARVVRALVERVALVVVGLLRQAALRAGRGIGAISVRPAIAAACVVAACVVAPKEPPPLERDL